MGFCCQDAAFYRVVLNKLSNIIQWCSDVQHIFLSRIKFITKRFQSITFGQRNSIRRCQDRKNYFFRLVLQTNLFSTKYKYVVTLTGGIFVSLFTIYVNIYLYWDMFHQFVGIDLHPSVVVDRIVWGDSSSEKWSELHYFPRVGGVWKISDTFHLHLTLMIWSKPLQASLHLQH